MTLRIAAFILLPMMLLGVLLLRPHALFTLRTAGVLADRDEPHDELAGVERRAFPGREGEGLAELGPVIRRAGRAGSAGSAGSAGAGDRRDERGGGDDGRSHDLRDPTKRARSGSTPPPPGSDDARATASATFSASSARDFSTPHTTGNVALPAAASLCAAFPSVAESASTSSRSSLIWKARPIRLP